MLVYKILVKHITNRFSAVFRIHGLVILTEGFTNGQIFLTAKFNEWISSSISQLVDRKKVRKWDNVDIVLLWIGGKW